MLYAKRTNFQRQDYLRNHDTKFISCNWQVWFNLKQKCITICNQLFARIGKLSHKYAFTVPYSTLSLEYTGKTISCSEKNDHYSAFLHGKLIKNSEDSGHDFWYVAFLCSESVSRSVIHWILSKQGFINQITDLNDLKKDHWIHGLLRSINLRIRN